MCATLDTGASSATSDHFFHFLFAKASILLPCLDLLSYSLIGEMDHCHRSESRSGSAGDKSEYSLDSKLMITHVIRYILRSTSYTTFQLISPFAAPTRQGQDTSPDDRDVSAS